MHVLYENEDQNISDDQISSQIEVLNADFRKLNINFQETPGDFASIAADSEIEFCLAKRDPDGNSTSGITRTLTMVNEIGTTDFWYQESKGGVDAWNVEEYINIWVCNLGENGSLGFATPPGSAEPQTSDGLVIAHQYFGTIGTASNSMPNHLGRTATHEMGHYLNLEHLWGPDLGGCDEDDFVNDTPEQDWESEECPEFPSYDDCTFSGAGLNFNNFMDYTDDSCMTMFTEGQKVRMLAALGGPRSTLLTSTACLNSSGVDDLGSRTKSVRIFPNPANEFIEIENSDILQKIDFKVFSISGEVLLEKVQNGYLDISNLPEGIYYLAASSSLRNISKFVIIR